MKDIKKQEILVTVDQISAGGVVFRKSGEAIEIAVVLMIPEMRWQLPKGIIDEGETIEEAALREVREEAGVDADLIAHIKTIEYWFIASWDGERKRFHKYVHFFLMQYRSGDVADHDHEVAESRWVEIGEAIEMLEFKSEKEVVEKAAGLLNARTAADSG